MFGSPDLDHAIRLLRSENPELAARNLRAAAAREEIRVAAAGLRPTVSFAPSVSRRRDSGNLDMRRAGEETDQFDVLFRGDWHPDLSGGTRSAIDARKAAARAAEFRAWQTSLDLEVALADAWVLRDRFRREGEVLDEAVALRREALGLVKRRRGAGVAGDLDLARAEAQLAEAVADRAAIGPGLARLEATVARLVNQIPEGDTEGGEAEMTLPDRPALNDFALDHRPDVQAALAAMEASRHQREAAEAARLPVATLATRLGLVSEEAGDLIDGDSLDWRLGVGLSQPLYTGGELEAREDVAALRERASEKMMRSVLLGAMSDAVAALRSWEALDGQVAAQEERVARASAARDLSLRHYGQGLVDYLAVLDAERERLDAERQRIAADCERLRVAVGLVQATGATW